MCGRMVWVPFVKRKIDTLSLPPPKNYNDLSSGEFESKRLAVFHKLWQLHSCVQVKYASFLQNKGRVSSIGKSVPDGEQN